MRHLMVVKGGTGAIERGSVLLTALFTILVLMLIAMAAASIGHLEATIASRYARSVQADYLLQAAIERVRLIIGNNPAVLDDPTHQYGLVVNEPELNGRVDVTVTRPTADGLILVEGTVILADGSRKSLQAAMTAPPDFEVYCQRIQAETNIDLEGILYEFGLGIPLGLTQGGGGIVFEELVKAACQEYIGDDTLLGAASITRRYQPPSVDIDFWRKAVLDQEFFWDGYAYTYFDTSTILATPLEDVIYAVDGDVLIYSDDTNLSMTDSLIIASGNISIINAGTEPTNIAGLILAGGDINLFQAANTMQVGASLCAGADLNMCTGDVTSQINMRHWGLSGFLEQLPPSIDSRAGFLSITALKEIYK